MTLAVLCSGQGTQSREMFALTGDAPQAAGIFAEAAQALDGRDPRRFVLEADDAALHANVAGQILCVTQALAAFAALRDQILAPGARVSVAGYSVGELAAAGCAGVFSAADALALARKRAALMDDAGGPDEGLAFVRGLQRTEVDALCARFDAEVAIINPGDLYVVGGTTAGLAGLVKAALAMGAAKAGALKVNVASHTARLAPAGARFREALAAVPTRQPTAGLRLIRAIDAAPSFSVTATLDSLAAQISNTIDWEGCLDACAEAGADAALELGPGRALALMASDALPGVAARSLEDFRSLDGARAWLAHRA